MVRAWAIEESELDVNKLDRNEENRSYLDLKELTERTGIICWQLNPDSYDTDGSLDKIRKDRGYSFEDEIVISSTTVDEKQMTKFVTEHLHSEEEIRLCSKGCAYFDVRNAKIDTSATSESWIRIEILPGDLLILPAGIYHRLTLTPEKFVQLKRLHIGTPVWSSYERHIGTGDQLELRKEYIQKFQTV